MTEFLDPFVTSGEIAISADDAVSAASGFVRLECGWHIWPQITSTVTVRPQGGRSLRLPTLQLASVSAITVNGVTLDPSNVTAWPYGELELIEPADLSGWGWGEGEFEWWDSRCWPSHGTVVVTFLHGYETVPPSVRAVCQSIATRWPASASPWTSRKMGTATLAASSSKSGLQPGSLTVVEQMVIDRFTVPRTP